MISLAQSAALALGGVGFSSPLLALRGRVALGRGGGKACADDVAASGAAASDVSASGATIDDEAASTAVAGDSAPEC